MRNTSKYLEKAMKLDTIRNEDFDLLEDLRNVYEMPIPRRNR
jgi:hypothetical protein